MLNNIGLIISTQYAQHVLLFVVYWREISKLHALTVRRLFLCTIVVVIIWYKTLHT